METTEKTNFCVPVTELVKRRTSVRTYSEQPLTGEARTNLEAFLSNQKGPFGSCIRFKLLDAAQLKTSDINLGVNPAIKRAGCFVAGAVVKGDRGMEDLGYCMENIILLATSLGLGTCWLATFKKPEFAKAMELQSNELMAVVTPVGYPGQGLNLLDSMVKALARAANRKNWGELFYLNSYGNPMSQADAGRYEGALEAVRLAPSGFNCQPWRIVREKNRFHFYLQSKKGKTDPTDLHRTHTGIAMCHFELAARESGLHGEWVAASPQIPGLPPDMEYSVSWLHKT